MCSKKIDMYVDGSVDGHGNYLFYNVFFMYVQYSSISVCVIQRPPILTSCSDQCKTWQVTPLSRMH